MKIVVDTNVFVSALIRPSDNFSSLFNYIDQNTTVLYSTETPAELVDVLRRQKFQKYTTTKDVADFITWVASVGKLVTVEQALTISRDSKDNKFLSLAFAGEAYFLVTGDKDLLVLGKIGDTAITSPAEFLKAIDH